MNYGSNKSTQRMTVPLSLVSTFGGYTMRALEFILNGKRLCIAAPPVDSGLVMSQVILCGGVPDQSTGSGELRFRVGGISDDHHLEWISQQLAVGDHLEIRVIDAPESDPPATRSRVTDEEHERLRIASDRFT